MKSANLIAPQEVAADKFLDPPSGISAASPPETLDDGIRDRIALEHDEVDVALFQLRLEVLDAYVKRAEKSSMVVVCEIGSDLFDLGVLEVAQERSPNHRAR